MQQFTLAAVIEKGVQYDPKSVQAKELTHSVARYLTKDMLPLHRGAAWYQAAS